MWMAVDSRHVDLCDAHTASSCREKYCEYLSAVRMKEGRDFGAGLK